MQTSQQAPAQVASKSPSAAKPQALVDTAAFALDRTTAAATKNVVTPAAQTCSKCESTEPWGGSAWCPHCGFYPKLGICIPVEAIQSQHVEEKLEAGEFPPYMKWLLGGGVVILLASVVARLQVPEDGPKTLWSIAQVSLGLFLLLASHIQAYTLSASRNEKLGIFDMLAAPAAVWRGAFETLPNSGWIVTRGGWGLVAILCGFIVVGGLGWEEINAMIASKAANQKKFKPLAAIASLANGKGKSKGKAGPENVEDAMNALVEELGVQELTNGGGGPAVEEEAGLKKQCAIVGYTKNVDGELKSVLLATMSAGRPDTYVAKVPVASLPANVSSRLAAVLPDMRTRRPSVEVPMQAYWVRPDLTCTMAFEEGAEEGTWSEIKFVEMLDAAGIEFNAEDTAEVLGETQKTLEQSLPQLQDALGGN
ncbi:MAG: hypothetical protein JNG89_02110 [Planctomycetaceae bacterium]|nr:hypothetical protein [Planctomycetaceae bacterium]